MGVSPISHRFKKTIRQGHIKSNGLVEWKKGSKDWKAYQLSEAAYHCADKWVLAVEGEGYVETTRSLSIANETVTFLKIYPKVPVIFCKCVKCEGELKGIN